MARKKFEPHPNKISSILFYLASIIIHGKSTRSSVRFEHSYTRLDLFRTDHKDYARSLTSSYLDLAPLYGSNQAEQDAMRTFKEGKLKPDCFSEKRLLGFPPGVGVLVIMFNRFHNSVVRNLALINENNRFKKPLETDTAACAKYDNDLFQTGRLITGGLYINCILKDYVRTILNLNRTNCDWSLDPRSEFSKRLFGEEVSEGGGNQVSAEFNLIYRWHSCVSERDDKWAQELYKELFHKNPSEVSMEEFVSVLSKWESGLSKDPLERPYAKLQRSADGSLNDDDLVRILTESVEDCAGPFGASQVPTVFRAVEILGIQQARSWNLASLNEFRKYFNLTPYKAFEEINPDPYIADQLRHFYDHPDHVELYPGLVVEAAKEPMVPASGLCASFTISRAILSDAVTLVRGDRFYTVDYTPKNLTNWGYKETMSDVATDHGHVFYKLILRAFPNHFRPDSVYAHFPLVIPSENENILTHLGISGNYSWDKPGRIPSLIMVESYAACKSILENQEDFKVTWGKAVEFLMHNDGHPFGRDFMLSGDDPQNAASRKMMQTALYRENWEAEVKKFYEHITLKLLHEKAYKIAGVNQVDVVRDIANLAQIHFCASVFALPLKTEENPRGVYSELELYMVMALVFTCIFFDADPAKSFPLRQASRKVTQQLGQLVMLNVQLIKRTGFIADLVDRFHRHDVLTEYGVHMIQRLLETDLSPKEIVWTHVLPTAGGMVANQAQLFSQCLDYYLSEEGAVHLPEIRRLAHLNTPEADDLLVR
jgi:linoleate 8R-lipoxygenase/9,12-octadecadienoate 8-hydroperoxide 8R-isomerase